VNSGADHIPARYGAEIDYCWMTVMRWK